MRHFEDIEVGWSQTMAEHALEADAIIAFAREWDPQPWHVDPEAADPLTPDAALAKRVLGETLSRNLLLLSAGSYGQVVRFIPPLVTTSEEVQQAIEVVAESLAAAGA